MTAARALAGAVALALAATGAAAPAAPADVTPRSGAWVAIPPAELAARYDTLWALSDVHGHLQELEQLLVASRLAVRRGPALAWTGERALLVVAGDLVDAGPDSVGVVLLLARLQREAASAGSRVVVLLGNHEARFLARPAWATPELMASAAVHRAELSLPRRFAPDALVATAFGEFLRGLPVAAFVGRWLFAHAGYVDADRGAAGARAWLARLDATVGRRDPSAFEALLDPRSVVAYHGWWHSEKRVAETRRGLRRLGMDVVVFGHDPDALGAPGRVAMSRDGSLIKLDAGVRRGVSRGMLLRCDVRDVVRAEGLAMARDGAPTCRAALPDGATGPLELR